MKKIIFIVSILLIISSGYSKEYKTGFTTVTSPRLGKVLTDNPERTIANIGNWGYWLRDNGESAMTPDGNSGGIYPRGTAGSIFLDGILVGGYQKGHLKVSGQIYTIGTERGYILNGEHITQSKDPRVRIHRIRKDWETLTANQVRQGAAELNSTTPGKVTDGQIQEILDQYKKDWEEWPTEIGAPYYDLNNNGVYEPELGETPGIANADQVVWFVITDANPSTTRNLYGTDPIGIEIQMTLWAYNQPGAGLGQIVFKQIRIINKGDGDLEDAYISLWSDPDLGNYSDDLVGVDVDKSLMYVYNGAVADDQYTPFGLAPPAVGYDFFAGPIVESPGDVAIFDLKERAGYKNLPASSFGHFSAGGVYSDPGPYGEVEGAREYYNLMRGFAPIDDLENPTPWLDENNNPTVFPYSGDPVAGTGHLDSSPADRRMLINSGPFVLAEGDTQDIVVAVVGGLGDNNLSSITAMKNTDLIAQKLFDDLFRSVPSAPAAPNVATHVTEGEVVLEWGSNKDAVFATENNPLAGYVFQGYNIYQLPSPTASKDQATRLATYDIIDDVTTIYGKVFVAKYGEAVNIPVQFGLDNGIVRSFVVDHDYLTGGPLYVGSDYYFAVTGYNYNPAPALIEDLSLESSLTPFLVKLTPAPVGMEYAAEYGDEVAVTHTGPSDGTLILSVVNPQALTGNDYEVYFDTDHYYLDVDGIWKSTAEPGVVAKLLDVSPSVVTGSAVTGPGGTLDLNFEVHVSSPDYNYAAGILVTVPGAVINSATGPDGVLAVIQPDGQSVLFGDTDMDGAGDFAGGEVVTINVAYSSVSVPIAFDYVVYDDAWGHLVCDTDNDGIIDPDMLDYCNANGLGPGNSVIANATGSGTIDELGYAFKSIYGWNVLNKTTGKLVVKGQTNQSGYAEESIVGGKLIPAGQIGAGHNPIVDGLQYTINGPPLSMKWIGVVSNAAGPLDPPRNGVADWRWTWLAEPNFRFYDDQQTNGSIWLFEISPNYGEGAGQDQFIASGLQYTGGNGSPNQGINAIIPYDFEWRFTEAGGLAFDQWNGNGNVPVPFEVWNIGIGTPDDPGDDYRLIPWILDEESDSGTGPFNGYGLFAGDHPTSGGTNDPYTDRIYVHAPTNDTPGQSGYDDFFANAAADASNTASWVAGPGENDPGGPLDTWNVFSRTVFVNWNGGDVADHPNYNALMPETGTTWRFVTTKPNTVADKFTFTAPANTVSDAFAKEAVKKINVFPNPYYANNSQELNRFDNFVTFTHLPFKAKIRIFSLDGKIVRELDKNTDSQYLQWDLRNHTNLPVASGIYFAHIDMDIDDQNLGTKVLKLFIIQANQVVKYY